MKLKEILSLNKSKNWEKEELPKFDEETKEALSEFTVSLMLPDYKEIVLKIKKGLIEGKPIDKWDSPNFSFVKQLNNNHSIYYRVNNYLILMHEYRELNYSDVLISEKKDFISRLFLINGIGNFNKRTNLENIYYQF